MNHPRGFTTTRRGGDDHEKGRIPWIDWYASFFCCMRYGGKRMNG